MVKRGKLEEGFLGLRKGSVFTWSQKQNCAV